MRVDEGTLCPQTGHWVFWLLGVVMVAEAG